MESSAGRAEVKRHGGEWLVRMSRLRDRNQLIRFMIIGKTMFALNQAMHEDLLL